MERKNGNLFIRCVGEEGMACTWRDGTGGKVGSGAGGRVFALRGGERKGGAAGLARVELTKIPRSFITNLQRSKHDKSGHLEFELIAHALNVWYLKSIYS